MNENDVIEMVKGELGFPMINVEIDQTQWELIVSRAKLWFTSKKGVGRMKSLSLVPNQGPFDVPDDCEYIDDLVLEEIDNIASIISFGAMDEYIPATFFPFNRSVSGYSYTFDIASYVQVLSSLRTRQKVFGGGQGYIVRDKQFWITANDDRARNCILFYRGNDFQVAELRKLDQNLFYEYCLARAKLILGRILRKYSNPPGAGGTITLDGTELYQEGQERIRELESEILSSQGYHHGFTYG